MTLVHIDYFGRCECGWLRTDLSFILCIISRGRGEECEVTGGLIRITCTYSKKKQKQTAEFTFNKSKIKLVTDQQQQESVADPPAAETFDVFLSFVLFFLMNLTFS